MQASRLTRAVAIAAAVTALGAPTAGAMPGPELTHNPASQDASAVSAPAPLRVPGPTVVVEADATGFDWGSAAIGAGVAFGVLLLGAAAGGAMRHGHLRPSH